MKKTKLFRTYFTEQSLCVEIDAQINDFVFHNDIEDYEIKLTTFIDDKSQCIIDTALLIYEV